MAWASKEEEAMSIVRLHMGVMKYDKKQEMSNLYTRLIFPNLGNSWSNVQWTTHGGVTYVTMWDNEHLLKNIKYAMMMEMLGLGPYKYCIVSNIMPRFESKLMLLMSYLPMEKMCFYPPVFDLYYPFQRPPWREWGEMIFNRRLNLKNPLLQTIYYT